MERSTISASFRAERVQYLPGMTYFVMHPEATAVVWFMYVKMAVVLRGTIPGSK